MTYVATSWAVPTHVCHAKFPLSHQQKPAPVTPGTFSGDAALPINTSERGKTCHTPARPAAVVSLSGQKTCSCISPSASMMTKAGAPSAAVLVAVLVLLAQPPPSASQSLEAIAPLLANQLVSLFQNNELQFMGFQCFYTQYPRIKSWELYYKGSFICPGWTAIRGRVETRSRSGVMRKTIENFLERVSAANLVSEEEARAWLEGY